MSSTLRQTEKTPIEQCIKELTSIVIDLTDSAFEVVHGSDDGGTVLEIKIERDEDGTLNIKKRPPSPYGGYRTVLMSVPFGYLSAYRKRK
jgi:hypothetical protein